MTLMDFIARMTVAVTAMFPALEVCPSQQCTCICGNSGLLLDFDFDCENDISTQSTCSPGKCQNEFYSLILDGDTRACWCDTLCTCTGGQQKQIDDICDCRSADSSTPSSDKAITSARTHVPTSRPLTSNTKIQSTPIGFNSVLPSAKDTDSFSTNPTDFNTMATPAGVTYGLINTDPSSLTANNKVGIGIGIAFGLAALVLIVIVLLLFCKRRLPGKSVREYIYTEPDKLIVGSSRGTGNMDNPSYDDIIEGTGTGQTKEIQMHPNATMVLTAPSTQYTELLNTESNEVYHSIQNDKAKLNNPNYEDIIENTPGKTTMVTTPSSQYMDLVLTDSNEVYHSIQNDKAKLANPNYEDISPGKTTMVSTPSSHYMDLVHTDSNEATQIIEAARVNQSEYAEPTFSASRLSLKKEDNKPLKYVNVDTPVETPLFSEQSSVPSGVSSQSSRPYVDVDAPASSHENHSSQVDHDSADYSRLQHALKSASGSTTYDILKHDVTQRAMESNSSNNDYGKLDILEIT